MNSFRALLLATAAIGLLSSCDSNDTYVAEPFPVGSTFELASFATVWGSKGPVGGANIRITFRGDGAIRGRTFTSERVHNTFSGTYEAGVDGSFEATPGVMTLVAEPEGSRIGDFTDGMRHAFRYDYQDGRLLIFYGAGILDLVEVFPTLPVTDR